MIKKKFGGTAMQKEAKNGTATGTQLVQIMYALSNAAILIVDEFHIGNLINCLNRKGQLLAEYLRKVFTALLSDKTILLSDEVRQSDIKKIRLIGSIKTGMFKNFSAADRFTFDNAAGVKFSGFQDGFLESFCGAEKDGPVSEAVIQYYDLNGPVHDFEIIADLNFHFETQLAHLWELLCNETVDPGVLSNFNVFYIRNSSNEVREVTVDSNDGKGWYIRDYSIGDPIKNPHYTRVFAQSS